MSEKRLITGIVSSADYDILQKICVRERCRMSNLVGKIVSNYLFKIPLEKVEVKKIKTARKIKRRAQKQSPLKKR